MQNTLPAPVLNNTFSTSDLYRRADMLQRFFEHLFFDPSPKTGSRAELIGAYYEKSDPDTVQHAHAISVWGDTTLDEYTDKNLYERIQELKTAGASMPKITLYIPVHFPLMQIERIGTWFRTEVQEGILLDIKIDPEAVGGCAFVHKNAYHDLSFSYFANKQRAAILSLVQTV